MVDPDGDLPVRTHDGAVLDLVKTLINSIVKDSETAHGDTPRDRLKFQVKERSDPTMVGAITALSTYGMARAAERQAAALETVAKVANRIQMRDTVDETAQAMVDLREPKRDYLATTYSLDPNTLMLLWSIRGMLVDASLRSLSKPERFEPYNQVTTEEIAWSLRVEPRFVIENLPRRSSGNIDYALLEEFDIYHYGGTEHEPDIWLYGG